MMINAMAYGAAELVTAEDILQGNSKVNMVFVTELFDIWHAKSCAPQPEIQNTYDSDVEESKRILKDAENRPPQHKPKDNPDIKIEGARENIGDEGCKDVWGSFLAAAAAVATLAMVMLI